MLGHITLSTQVSDELGPFRPEYVGASQGTISAADYECVYALFDQIVGCRQPSLRSTESFRARRPNQRSALCPRNQQVYF